MTNTKRPRERAVLYSLRGTPPSETNGASLGGPNAASAKMPISLFLFFHAIDDCPNDSI